MTSFIVELTVSRVKSGQTVFAVCPFCKHYARTYNAFRKHMEYHHRTEPGFEEAKKTVSKLYRIYEKGVKSGKNEKEEAQNE